MCRVTKLDKIRNEGIRGTTKVGKITEESPGKEGEVVWACDEKTEALRLDRVKEETVGGGSVSLWMTHIKVGIR